MIIPSLFDANDEDWVNHFALTFDDEVPQDVGPLAIIDDCHMQMIYYDEELENLGPHISDDISMDSIQSYLFNTMYREACYTEDSLANI